ncbi:MAG TPA: GreA/GreB family elongation factor [Longimicrobiales bacterium]|jgi:transcription elongation factor GreA
MIDEIRDKIEAEIERLIHELNRELPERIGKALELGDLRENAEHKAALERQQFVQARIGHLQSRVAELNKIDLKAMPFDRVGFGSKVRVLDAHLNEEKDFTLVAGDFMDFDKGHISLESPIGRGLMGARVDDEVMVELPVGPRTFRILDLVTLPQQIGAKPGELP